MMESKEAAMGHTLVESLIGITIGSVVVLLAVSLFVPSLNSYKQVQAIAHITEIERSLFRIFSQSLPSAGYLGCDSSKVAKRSRLTNIIDFPVIRQANITVNQMPWSPVDSHRTVLLFPSDTDMSPFIGTSRQNKRIRDTDNRTLVGDVLFALEAGPYPLSVATHDAHGERLSFRGNQSQPLKKGAIIALNDCEQVTLLRVSQPHYQSATSTTQITYSKATLDDSGHGSISHCYGIDAFGAEATQTWLGRNNNDEVRTNCLSQANRARISAYQFRPGAQGVLLSPTFYYLAYPSGYDKPTPSLYRLRIEPDGEPGLAQEIVAGVENFRGQYGIQLSHSNLIQYLTAEQFTGDQDLDSDGINETWQQLKKVRLHFLLRSSSGEGEKATLQSQTFYFPNTQGEPILCNDTNDTSENPSACPEFINADYTQSSYFRRVLVLDFFLFNNH